MCLTVKRPKARVRRSAPPGFDLLDGYEAVGWTLSTCLRFPPLNSYKYRFSWRSFSFLFWFLHLKLPTPTSKFRHFLGKVSENSNPFGVTLCCKACLQRYQGLRKFQKWSSNLDMEKLSVISSFQLLFETPTLRGPTFCANQSPTGGNQSWMGGAVMFKCRKRSTNSIHLQIIFFSFHDNNPRCRHRCFCFPKNRWYCRWDIIITQLAGKIPLPWRWLNWSERWRSESNASEFDPG